MDLWDSVQHNLYIQKQVINHTPKGLKRNSMKKIFLPLIAICAIFSSCKESIDSIINAEEVERIERILASDEMEGRRTFTPGIDKAADFIAEDFKSSGLEFFGDNDSYFQHITMIQASANAINGKFGKESLNTSNVVANTTAAEINIESLDGYTVVVITKEDNLFQKAFPLTRRAENIIVLIDEAHKKNFARMPRLVGRAKFPSKFSQIFILTKNVKATSIELNIKNTLKEQKLKNVVGVIPGKSKKDEYVVFGGHYDHLGIGKPDKNKDSIFNGANDDASGTTAVMMLAKYFNKVKDNERTLVFVAFTAEEMGGFGSKYFSKQLNPDKVMAMFNIEMIGTESKWGTNSAYITGFERSSMGKILQKNLSGSKFRFEPDPYPKQNLFYRSDNATLAELGVPAHTIATAKMDEKPNNEPNYHKQSDEIETLDMVNMSEIIKSIALSSKTIISGEDTPTRVTLPKR